jgi:hypothetical protein
VCGYGKFVALSSFVLLCRYLISYPNAVILSADILGPPSEEGDGQEMSVTPNDTLYRFCELASLLNDYSQTTVDAAWVRVISRV